MASTGINEPSEKSKDIHTQHVDRVSSGESGLANGGVREKGADVSGFDDEPEKKVNSFATDGFFITDTSTVLPPHVTSSERHGFPLDWLSNPIVLVWRHSTSDLRRHWRSGPLDLVCFR